MAYRGFDLTGKVSLITGGNGGIGFGMADALAEAGADVCIWGTNPTKNASAVEKLRRHGRKIHAQIVDVGDQAQVQAGFAETLKVMGHVDNCVANSGVSGRGKGSLLEMDYEEWRRVMRVNLDGVFFTFQTAARHMVERGKGGSLVAMASTAAIDDEVAPRRVARGAAGQVDGDRPEIGADTPAALGNARHHVAGELLVAERIGRHLGLDPARQDGIGRDLVARQLDGQRPHHGADAALTGAVVTGARRAFDGGGAGHRHQ